MLRDNSRFIKTKKKHRKINNNCTLYSVYTSNGDDTTDGRRYGKDNESK